MAENNMVHCSSLFATLFDLLQTGSWFGGMTSELCRLIAQTKEEIWVTSVFSILNYFQAYDLSTKNIPHPRERWQAPLCKHTRLCSILLSVVCLCISDRIQPFPTLFTIGLSLTVLLSKMEIPSSKRPSWMQAAHFWGPELRETQIDHEHGFSSLL